VTKGNVRFMAVSFKIKWSEALALNDCKKRKIYFCYIHIKFP